jgi:predicted RNA-binding Zn-ribbon protein involved in translation (DUF1610 family)
MQMQPLDFAASYSKMSEPELMALAQGYDSLTGDAQAAIREEFARRGLEPPLLESEPLPEKRNLVTIRRYRDLSEAIVARSLLESAGIPVYLRDENLVRLDWQVSNFIGGIRLQVEADDESAAVELLNQPVSPTIELPEGEEFTQPKCPACGSTDITFEGASRGAALASLYVLSLPLPSGRETWSCSACGNHWEETEG